MTEPGPPVAGDELEALGARLVGPGPQARQIAAEARAAGEDRLTRLEAAVRSSRAHPYAGAEPRGEGTLAAAVAAEMSRAAGRLPAAQREALALRELLRLPHREIAEVTGVAPDAVAPLLADARIELRSALRETPPPAGGCVEDRRTRRVVTLRQDDEPVSVADEDWLYEHLGHCAQCGRAHAAMHEGSASYRARREDADG